ncbi:Cell division protein FtsZ [Nymphon striatum]|nr:Cell division protein FtsZ [Nymphon striatum]
MSNNTEFEGISFDLPKNQSNVIKVIGVGGGGSNAINHMFQAGINGVDFVILNTDSQALTNSSVPNKIQLGVSLTEGLGAGANPEVGEQAAIESTEDIKTMLDVTTKMVFITAGMGGGTGTGAAPVIAKMAKEMDILTVGIVTMPFQFEGKMRCEQAQLGIERLRNNVDSLIVINNNKLREVYGNLGFKAGFSKADEVLATAARGIAEDLKRLLIDEIGEINDHIQVEAGHGANIIMGVGEDPELGESIAVTVIATGFDIDQQDDIVNIEDEVAVKETVVKHTLIDEMEELDLIPTTNYIKNFNVFYEEVIAENVSEDDFIIIDSDDTLNDIDVVDHQVVAGIEIEEDQIEMSFDLPLVTDNEEENENTIVFSLDEEIGEMDVNDHIEVIPVLEYNKEGETRYSLDDYMELENQLTGAKSKAEEFEPKIIEDELIFERKTLVAEKKTATETEVDPMDSPLEELLRERADERRRKLKDFNYKFQNSLSNIDEIEKQPAYKRQGVDLNENRAENRASRTSLSEDSNDEIQLRSNNSFLHDNVD